MLQLRNSSPFSASVFALPDQAAVDTLFVVVKATFRITAAGVVLADEPQPVILSDEYCGEPGASSLRYASEVHLFKPGTDVVVVGDACALGERPAPHVDVSMGVAGRIKHARVHGERYWTEGVGGMRPSKAKPFVRMPVTWERTHGGRHVLEDGRSLEEPRNPVGCSFVGKRPTKELLGHPAPNVEDIAKPTGLLGERAGPVGFGPIAPSWEPRRNYAGTYDEAWKKTQAPYLPRDFDPRFFQVAPEELVIQPRLVGGEPVALQGFHPRGLLRFDLPRCELHLAARISGRRKPLAPRLELIVLEPTDERFTMSWRAALPVDKKLLRVDTIDVALKKIEGAMERRRSA